MQKILCMNYKCADPLEPKDDRTSLNEMSRTTAEQENNKRPGGRK